MSFVSTNDCEHTDHNLYQNIFLIEKPMIENKVNRYKLIFLYYIIIYIIIFVNLYLIYKGGYYYSSVRYDIFDVMVESVRHPFLHDNTFYNSLFSNRYWFTLNFNDFSKEFPVYAAEMIEFNEYLNTSFFYSFEINSNQKLNKIDWQNSKPISDYIRIKY